MLVWEIMAAQRKGSTKLRPSVKTQPPGATLSALEASEFGGPTVREFVPCDLLACCPFHKSFEARLGEWVWSGQESALGKIFRWRTLSVYGPVLI